MRRTTESVEVWQVYGLDGELLAEYASGGAPSAGYSAGLAQGLPVRTVHIQELRDRVLATWQIGGGGAPEVRWLVADYVRTPRMIADGI